MAAQGLTGPVCLLGAVLAASSAGCESECEAVAVSACDITQRSCQRELLLAVACERGEAAPALPAMRVITQAQYREELNEATQDDDAEASPWDTALTLLGLLAPGIDPAAAAIDESVESVAAYYDPATRDITVIASSMPDNAATRAYIMSHELTHYLQDVHYGLAALSQRDNRDYDSRRAHDALIEGDAVVTSGRIYARLQGWRAGVDWDALFDSMEDSSLESIAESSTRLFVAGNSLPYFVGGRRIAALWDDYGRRRVNDLYARPIAHLVDWFGESAGGTRAEPLDCAPPLPPEGLVLYGLDTFGATGVIALLAGEPDALELGAAVVGDALAVYADAAGGSASARGVGAAWRLRFETQTAAQMILQRLAARIPDATVERLGVEVLISSSDVPAAALSAAARAACPTFASLVPADEDNASNAALRFRPPSGTLPQSLGSPVSPGAGMVRAGGFEPP
jgi:hypothetical protein